MFVVVSSWFSSLPSVLMMHDQTNIKFKKGHGNVAYRVYQLFYNKGWNNIKRHMVIGCKLAYMVTLLTFQTHLSRNVYYDCQTQLNLYFC